MMGIDQDDLEKLLLPVLPHPIRIEHLQVREVLLRALLGDPLQALRERHAADALVFGPTSGNDGAFPLSPPTHPDANDDEPLLGAPSERTGPVQTGRMFEPVDRRLPPPRQESLVAERCTLRSLRYTKRAGGVAVRGCGHGKSAGDLRLIYKSASAVARFGPEGASVDKSFDRTKKASEFPVTL